MMAEAHGDLTSRSIPEDVPAWWWLGLFPGVALLLSQWALGPLVGAGDYAQYLLHAKAIAEGRPYTDIGYLTTTYAWGVGPALQPPLLPLLLAPLVKVFGADSSAIKVLSYLLMWGFLAFAGHVIARWYGRGAAIVGVSFTALAMAAAYALTAPITDIPFALLVWWLIAKGDRSSEWSWPTLLGLLVIAGLATATRVVGVVLPAAVLVAGLLRGGATRRRCAQLCVAAVVAGVAAAVMFADRLPDIVPSLGLKHTRLIYLLRRPLEYLDGVMQITQYPFPGNRPNDIWHLLALLLLVFGVVLMVKGRWRTTMVVTVASYALLLLLAPIATPRYIWPLFPFLGAATAVGLERVLRLRIGQHSGRLAAGLLIAVGVASAVRLAARPRPALYLELADVQQLMQWMRHTDRAGSRVVFENARVLTLETGLSAMTAFVAPDVERTARELDAKQIRYVVTGGHIDHKLDAELRQRMESMPGPWVPVYEVGAYRVWERPGSGVER